MKLKDFLRGTTFKCIVVLCSIALVAGGLLSILNDLFAVSKEEELARMLASVYDKEGVTVIEDVEVEYDKAQAEKDRGYVREYLPLSDGNVILRSVGLDGYHGGYVTLWVVALFDENQQYVGLEKVSIDSDEKNNPQQSFLSQVDEQYLDSFVSGEIPTAATPAPYTKNAINNAVKVAVNFAQTYDFTEVLD